MHDINDANLALEVFLKFIQQVHPPCERLVCGTCGGILHFERRLHEFFPDNHGIESALLRLTEVSLGRFSENQHKVIWQTVKSLEADAQARVQRQWVQNSTSNPSLAMAMFNWTGSDQSFPPNQMKQLVWSAEPLLIANRAARQAVRKHLWWMGEWPPRLAAIYEADDEVERQSRARERLRLQLRKDYLDSLNSLPFQVRIPVILADKSIQYSEKQATWAFCSNEELLSMGGSTIQELIDVLEPRPFLCASEDILQQLYDRRHELRLQAMAAFRQEHGKLPPEEQLRLLVQDLTIPIANYPVELAEFANIAWLATLTTIEATHFQDILCKTRLRLWRKVRQRLAL